MINFLKHQKLYFAISFVTIVAGLISIFSYGYKNSIDFTGGTILEYQTSKGVDVEKLSGKLKSQKLNVVEKEVNGKILTLKFEALNTQQEKVVLNELKKEVGNVTVLRAETVGATLGNETIIKTVTASIVAIFGILIYLTLSFKSVNFALSAVVALLHDLLVMVGGYSIVSYFFGAELNTLFVTAILTTMSFSVHDTIVIFDKIREYRRTKSEDIVLSANRAVTETIIRSINNSMTIVFMLLALILFGGSTIRFFIVALLIGTITGTYSSPFVATPFLVWLEKRRKH